MRNVLRPPLRGAVRSPFGLGPELWDGPASRFDSGTYSWVVFGANTIANVSNTLEITWIDSSNGALDYFKAASDLSSDLVVGKNYRYTAEFRVSAGSATPQVNDGGGVVVGALVDKTYFQTQSIDFTAASATAAFAFFAGLGAGEKIYVKNPSLREIL